MSNGVHLHVASGYSARYGASHPRDLVRRATERGIGTLALTDRDTVTGAVRFAKAATAAGIRPVFGVDVAVAPHTPARPGSTIRPRTPVRGGAHVVEPPLRVTLLARSTAGWARLCRLVSDAHADAAGALPVVSWETLGRYADEDLVVLLGPVSEPARALSAGRPDLAEHLIAPWREMAGANLRLETVCWGVPGTGPGSLRLAARTIGLADQLGVRAVLTNAVRYADPAQHRIADVLDAGRLLRPIDRRRLDCGERWLKDPAAMQAAAERIAEASGADSGRAAALLAETVRAGEECVLDPVADLGLGTPHFPEPEVVGAEPGPGGAMRLLRQRCETGMFARGLDRDRRAVEQLEYELGVIGKLEYEAYFLAVAQVVADVRAMGIRVAARGSGAGSMVNHALFVATANPLDHDLLFERFLSERRSSLPDIDVDVESARRLEVYDRIIERFGTDRVAVTGMPETYRARHALRDTGLALGIAPQVVDRIAKSFPHIRACDIRDALATLPELKQLASEADSFGPLWELAEGLDKLPRGIAMHPCGVILSNSSLLERLPVQPTPGRPVPDGPGRQGGRRRPRPAQARRPRGADAVRDGARRQRGPPHDRPPDRPRQPRPRPPRRPGRLRPDPQERHHRDVPAGVARPAGPGRPAPAARRPGRHRRHQPLPARAGQGRHARPLHRRPPRRRPPVPPPRPGARARLDVRGDDLARADHRHVRRSHRMRPGTG
ncbi:hypothetical protein GCM10020254_86950 [Streptomyces goshikiensis]